MKNLVIDYVNALLKGARSRKTSQGVRVYEVIIDQLKAANTDQDVLDILARLKAVLIGIDTHGFFPPSEYDVVKKILSLPQD
jgi:hypothetical protein